MGYVSLNNTVHTHLSQRANIQMRSYGADENARVPIRASGMNVSRTCMQGMYTWTSKVPNIMARLPKDGEYRQHRVHDFRHLGGPGRPRSGSGLGTMEVLQTKEPWKRSPTVKSVISTSLYQHSLWIQVCKSYLLLRCLDPQGLVQVSILYCQSVYDKSA